MSSFKAPRTSAEKTARDRNLTKLPEMAFVNVADEDVMCIVKRGEPGYCRTDWPIGTEHRQELIDERNRRLGVAPAQASAMVNGSMFGWFVKGADADHEVNASKEVN